MKWLNRIISIFLIGLSIIICLTSIKLGIGEFGNPGPGFLPFFSSFLLFFLCLVVFINDFIRTGEGEEKGPLMARETLKKPIVLVVLLFGFAFLLNVFGYLITSFLLMFLMFFMLDPKKWRMHIVVGAIVASLSFFFFKWFQVQLPTGIFHIGGY